jgi:hypothetical protein
MPITKVKGSVLDESIVTDADIGVSVQPYDATILASKDIGVTVQGYDATILNDADIGVTVQGYDATLLNAADIGVTVQGYDATTLKSKDIGVTVQGYDATLLNAADIGVTVQGYDATIVVDADIGITVQPYDATTLKSKDIGVTVQGYDATLLNAADIGVTVQAYDKTIVVDADIGTTVQPYDATILKSADIGTTVQAYDKTIVVDADIGVTVQAYDATLLNAADIGTTVQAYDKTIVVDADIGTTVQPYDATILNAADIGVTVQGYDATLLNAADIGVSVQGYDATLLNAADIGVTVQGYDATILKSADIGTTVQAYDKTIVVDADIGVTVQPYDATIVVDADIGTTVEPFGAAYTKAEVDAAGGNTGAKADKVSLATVGNFAGLDANGNLTDSGSDAADFAAASHTHVEADITDLGDYATRAEVRDGSFTAISSVGGTNNAITGTCTPTLSSWATGQTFFLTAALTNTGATTANFGPSAVAVELNGSALTGGEIQAGGAIALHYDGAALQLISGSESPTITNLSIPDGPTLHALFEGAGPTASPFNFTNLPEGYDFELRYAVRNAADGFDLLARISDDSGTNFTDTAGDVKTHGTSTYGTTPIVANIYRDDQPGIYLNWHDDLESATTDKPALHGRAQFSVPRENTANDVVKVQVSSYFLGDSNDLGKYESWSVCLNHGSKMTNLRVGSYSTSYTGNMSDYRFELWKIPHKQGTVDVIGKDPTLLAGDMIGRDSTGLTRFLVGTDEVPSFNGTGFVGRKAPIIHEAYAASGASALTVTGISPRSMCEVYCETFGTADHTLRLQLSNDSGVNWTDTSGDTEVMLNYREYGGSSLVLDVNTDSGVNVSPVTSPGGAGGAAESKTFSGKLVQSSAVSTGIVNFHYAGVSHDSAGDMFSFDGRAKIKNHAANYDQVRVVPSAGTIGGHLVIVEHPVDN